MNKRTLQSLECDRVDVLMTIEELTDQINACKSLTEANAFIPLIVQKQIQRSRLDGEIERLAEEVTSLYTDYKSMPATEQVLGDRLIKGESK